MVSAACHIFEYMVMDIILSVLRNSEITPVNSEHIRGLERCHGAF